MCEKNIDLMMEYMDGGLDDFEKMNLEKHIETCQVCAEDFKAYSDILQGFEEMEMVEAPEGFTSSVMEQVNELDLYSPAKVAENLKSKVIDSLIFAGFGLAAVVVFGGGALALFGGEILSLFYGAGMYGVAGFVAPVAEICATIVGNISNWASNLGEWSQETLVFYGVAFLAIFAVLVLLQINMTQKPKEAKASSRA
ncbi:MAG: zf-HC2 domain-containing protein [Defluviitaleaceae bacterium]|nr:zf-HC2 domain-containing protein [Defluviitaleaceae bacterium]